MVARKISGYGEFSPSGPAGPPLPLWRERHLPPYRGSLSLAEGGKRGMTPCITRRMGADFLIFPVSAALLDTFASMISKNVIAAVGVDADDVPRGKAGDLDVLRRGGAERHLRAAAPREKLQVNAVVHAGADLRRVDDLLTQQEKRPGVAADKVKVAVLQIVGFIGQQLKRAGRGGQGVLGRQRDGGSLLHGMAQR